ncbi:unnamed protein product [Staurois parvus]|uniref:Uncharacterized protein n=1 Tax=Staurois parvus TaxID=386267 RepID=A0ABN9EV01_9NEOB|nr:unnamed protein product [Staurois parvus]
MSRKFSRKETFALSMKKKSITQGQSLVTRHPRVSFQSLQVTGWT